MNYLNKMNCKSDLNVGLNENSELTLQQRYRNIKHLEISADLDDDNLPAFLSMLVPFDDSHIIFLFDPMDGSKDMKIQGTVDVPDELHGHVIFCKLWILESDKVHFQVIEKFLGQDERGDPAPADYLLNDKGAICRIVEIILEYYLGATHNDN